MSEPVGQPFRPTAGTAWEYYVENLTPTKKWGGGDPVAAIGARMNQIGQDGWELVSYTDVGLHGGFTGDRKSTTYLAVFKRPK
jgi:hypothetical protein